MRVEQRAQAIPGAVCSRLAASAMTAHVSCPLFAWDAEFVNDVLHGVILLLVQIMQAHALRVRYSRVQSSSYGRCRH